MWKWTIESQAGLNENMETIVVRVFGSLVTITAFRESWHECAQFIGTIPAGCYTIF